MVLPMSTSQGLVLHHWKQDPIYLLLGYCSPSNLLPRQAPAFSVTEQEQPKAWDNLIVPVRTCSDSPPLLWQSRLTCILVPATVL